MHIPHVFYWIGSGILFAVSFIHPFLWWCFIPAFIGLLFLIEKEFAYKKLFLYGWLVGVLHTMGAIFWFWNTFPLSVFDGHSVSIQLFLIGVYWSSISMVIGVSTGLFTCCAKKIMGRTRFLLLALPFVWVFLEIAQAYIFSMYSLGNGGYLNVNFSFGYLGYVLAENNIFLFLSQFGGVYMLSFLAAMLCVGLFALLKYCIHFLKYIAPIIVMLFLVLFLAPMSYGEFSPSGKKIIVIETYFDTAFFKQEDQKETRQQEVIDAVAQALLQQPDFVILPEDSRFSEGFSTQDDIYDWATNTEAVIIDSGAVSHGEGTLVLRANIHDLRTRDTFFLDKQYLVPQGEYPPALSEKVLSLFLSDEDMSSLNSTLQYRMGVYTDVEHVPHDIPTILFCFESVAPLNLKKLLQEKQNPPFVAHLISHSWFHNPEALWYQLDNMLLIQSVWQKIPIVSAANMAQSKMYMPTGEIELGTVIETTQYWSLVEFEI